MTTGKTSILSEDWPKASQFKKSIRFEFTAYVSGIILVLMLVTGYVISSQYERTVTRNVADKILVQARSYSGPSGKMIISGDEPDVLMLNNMCKRIALDNADVYWAGITADRGVFLAHTDIRQVVAEAHMAAVTPTRFQEMLRPGEGFELAGDTIYVSVPIKENEITVGRLAVAASAGPIRRARRTSFLAVASITAVMILGGIPVTVLVLRRKLRPIQLITDHLKAVDFREISLDIPYNSRDEFGFLAETMRVMGSKLRVAQGELIEKERMTRELEIAREIQAKILPRSYPRGLQFDLAAAYHSALEVGGDYYDFIEFDDHRLGLLIADVSGKSLPGMLVMLLTRDIVKRLARSVDEPARLLTEVNRELVGNIKKGMFVTMFFGILDRRDGRFTFASAGHNPLIHIDGASGEADLIKTKGYPLGMIETGMYEQRVETGQINLYLHDWLVLYTDGVNEAQNADGHEFGMERFTRAIRTHRDLKPEVLVDALVREHRKFVGNAPQFDDITLMAVKWTGVSADKCVESALRRPNAG
jgi:serine phosphatase RsbU (regulator of sigma subunit)